MDPFFARNRLSSYLDGTLSDAEAAEVSEAIEHDPTLKEEYEALRRAVNFIKRAGPTEAPSDFHAKVLAAVSAEKAPGGKLVWLFRPLARVPVEAIGVAAAALLVVLFVAQRHRTEVAQEKKETADAVASQPVKNPPVVVEPAQQPQIAMKVPAEETIATGSANGRAETTFPAAGGAKDVAKEPAPQMKQAPKTGYSADNPFVPEWEQQAAGEQAAEGWGAGNVPQDVGVDQNTADEKNTANTASDNTGSTNQVLSNGVAVPAVYPYALRVSSAETVGDLARSVEAMGGTIVDASGARIDPASFADGDQPALVRAIVKPGSVDAMTKLLARYGATSKTKPPSSAEFASQTVEFDLSITYAD
jgi:negative regulator of sigma E activity